MVNRAWDIAVIAGDGTGPDIIAATVPVIEAVKKKFKLNINLTFGEGGLHCVEKYGTNLPPETLELLKRSDCVIKGLCVFYETFFWLNFYRYHLTA